MGAFKNLHLACTCLMLLAGYITGSQWSSAVESVLKLDVPWNMLRHQLAHVLPDGRVDYSSCLDQYVIETGLHKVHVVIPKACNFIHRAIPIPITPAINTYKCSFYTRTIPEWNSLLAGVIVQPSVEAFKTHLHLFVGGFILLQIIIVDTHVF